MNNQIQVIKQQINQLTINTNSIKNYLIIMIAEQDQNKSNHGSDGSNNALSHLQDYQDQTPEAFENITHHPYINKVFCWIQSGNTKDVIKFFNTFPHLLNNFYSPNNWNPFMYAVRYGNRQLMAYFKEKGMNIHPKGVITNISIVHTAVYSGKVQVLASVLRDLNSSPNPSNTDTSPLKIAMKAGNVKMVELLAAKGAYYVFGDIMNNLEQKSSQGSDDNFKYVSFISNKQIHNSLVVQDSAIKDCPIKEVLRYSRVKPFMHLQRYAKDMLEQGKLDSTHKFHALASMLYDKQIGLNILRACIGKGYSLMSKNSEHMQV